MDMKPIIRHTILAVVTAILLALAASCGKKTEVTEYNIIPQPEYLVQKGRSYTLSSSTRLCFENLGRNTPTAKYITTSLRKMHVRPAFIGTPQKDCILFALNDTLNPELGDEGYLLQVIPDGIFISANSETGLFYAFQTFIQMLPPDVTHTTYRRITLPECTILDRPSYPFRGNLLDVCRHFIPAKEIKRHLDLLAAYKLNKFIWHLSDDQGWRIETEHYPALNDIGSWRVNRDTYPWGSAPPPAPGEEPTYGGYYTRREIADIVAYAAQRHIEVIPAIELPGHCSAILAAYPTLGCSQKPRIVATGPCWPPDALLCAGNDSTLILINTILDEITDLFPSENIHIGCSYTSFEPWEQCSRCQTRKQQHHLGSEEELAGWLITQTAAHLALKGKKIMGWDDLLDLGTPPPDATVTTHRGDSLTNLALRLSPRVVAAPSTHCNLDTYQADTAHHPAAFPTQLTLYQAYNFNPMPPHTPTVLQPLLQGGVSVLWTDYILNYRQAEYLLLPRLCALAESLWTPAHSKDWQRFRHSIEQHKKRLAAEGYNPCPGNFKPLVTKTTDRDALLVTITTETEDTYVYYTTDGSDPTPDSPLYTAPLRLPHGTLLRTLTLYHGRQQESIYNFQL